MLNIYPAITIPLKLAPSDTLPSYREFFIFLYGYVIGYRLNISNQYISYGVSGKSCNRDLRHVFTEKKASKDIHNMIKSKSHKIFFII